MLQNSEINIINHVTATSQCDTKMFSCILRQTTRYILKLCKRKKIDYLYERLKPLHHIRLPFDCHKLPFDCHKLPFDCHKLPFDCHFSLSSYILFPGELVSYLSKVGQIGQNLAKEFKFYSQGKGPKLGVSRERSEHESTNLA